MLNKELCHMCQKNYYHNEIENMKKEIGTTNNILSDEATKHFISLTERMIENFNSTWIKEKCTFCPIHLDEQLENLKITSKPPQRCPYILEQFLKYDGTGVNNA